MARELTLDLTVEDEADLESLLGENVDTGAGQVHVRSTGHQPGAEIVTVTIIGHVPAIIAWMINRWEDDELALEEFATAIKENRYK